MASCIFETKGGTKLEVRPHPGRTGAVGIFFPRDGMDSFFPTPVSEETYAEGSATEGGKLVRSTVKNSTGAGSVIVAGDGPDEFRGWYQRWQALCEDMRKNGGFLHYMMDDGEEVTYVVESLKTVQVPYNGLYLAAHMQEYQFSYTCEPYGLLATRDQLLRDHDTFSYDSLLNGEWAYDTGAGTLEIVSEKLTPTSTGAKRLVRLGGETFNSITTILASVPESTAAHMQGVFTRRINASLSLKIAAERTSTGIKPKIVTPEHTVSGTAVALSANNLYWLRAICDGNEITAEIWLSDPDGGGEPASSKTIILEEEDAIELGEYETGGIMQTASGGAGLYYTEQGDKTWIVYEWRHDSYLFVASKPIFAVEIPATPGQADALAEFNIQDAATKDRKFVDFGQEIDDYDAESVQPSLFAAPLLTTSGFSGELDTKTGAFDPTESGENTVVHSVLSRYAGQVCSTGPIRCHGNYRVKVRVNATGGTTYGGCEAYIRYAVAAAGGSGWTRGDWVRIPHTGSWYDIDLGITAMPGDEESEIRIEAFNAGTEESSIDINYLELMGAGRYGKSKIIAVTEAPLSVTASDTFDQTEETANGQVLGHGGSLELTRRVGLYGMASGESYAWPSQEEGKWRWFQSGTIHYEPPLLTETHEASTSYFGFNLSGGLSQWLSINDLEFDLEEGAEVTGVKMWVLHEFLNEVSSAGGVATIDIMSFSFEKEKIATSEKTVNVNSKTLGWSSIGGPGELWGVTSSDWTEAINESAFAMNYRVHGASGFGTSNENTISVQEMVAQVWYTPKGGSAWKEYQFGATHSPAWKIHKTDHLLLREGAFTLHSYTDNCLYVPGEYKTQSVQIDVRLPGTTHLTGAVACSAGPMVRFKESNKQHVEAILNYEGSTGKWTLYVRKYDGTTGTILSKTTLTDVVQTEHTIKLTVEEDGRWLVWLDEELVDQGVDKALSEGEFAEGACGVYSEGSGTVGLAIDNYVQWTPDDKAAMWANRNLYFKSDAATIENSTGTNSPALGYEGARLKIPAAGLDGKTSRIAVRARRQNIDEVGDEYVSDGMKVSLKITPRVLLLP